MVSRIKNHRRGIATLEAVLALPFLAALVAVILAIGSGNLKRSIAVNQARQDAWKGREQGLAAEPTALRVLQIEMLRGGGPRPGLKESLRTERVSMPGFLRNFSSARGKHVVLGGAYDYRVIDFGRGSPLVPGEVTARLGAASIFGDFAGLDFFLRQGGAGFSVSPGQLEALMEQANRVMRRAQDLADSVRRLVRRIENITKVVKNVEKLWDEGVEGFLRDPVGFIGDLAGGLLGGLGGILGGGDSGGNPLAGIMQDVYQIIRQAIALAGDSTNLMARAVPIAGQIGFSQARIGNGIAQMAGDIGGMNLGNIGTLTSLVDRLRNGLGELNGKAQDLRAIQDTLRGFPRLY